MYMRTFLATSAIALGLTACSTEGTTPAQPASSPAPAAATSKAPQCWNGDAGAFMDVGIVAKISGVDVVCEKTSDGKNAQWMGKKN